MRTRMYFAFFVFSLHFVTAHWLSTKMYTMEVFFGFLSLNFVTAHWQCTKMYQMYTIFEMYKMYN